MAFSPWRMFVVERVPRLHIADAGRLPVRRGERKRGRSARIRGVGPSTRSARPGRFRSGVPGSAECEGEQARAKQHEACCGYCEESFGYEIVVTHDAPADRDVGPNLLKLSESFALQHRPRTIALISVSEENAGADEAKKSCNHLDHRNCPKRPWHRTETTLEAAQSKGFRTGAENRNPTDDLQQHHVPEGRRRLSYFGCSVFGRAASCARAAIIASYSGVPRRGGEPSGRPPIQCGMSANVSPGVLPPAQAGSVRHAIHRKAHRRAAE
jgi:hypothetical protein